MTKEEKNTPKRRVTRRVKVGTVAIGGGAPVTVQSMLNTRTTDIDGCVRQIEELSDAGCDLIRLAVPDEASAEAFGKIAKATGKPLIADIHYSCKLAHLAIDGGAKKIRMNPGNMHNAGEIRELARRMADEGIPVRVGVNGGSRDPKFDGKGECEALVESALECANVFESCNMHDIVVAVKASDVRTMVAANRALAAACDYPLHLGVTEAGGSYALLGETLRVARELIVEASAMRRTPCPLSKLAVAVKCGTSDATSGIAGNPCVGAAFDRIVKAGGTAFWSETTEIIGAEDIVAARAASPEVSAKILAAAARWEEKARSTGEDIREINPIPANIAAGISTLEEKSLGAIAKSGSCPIEDVLDYGEQPKGHGLYFIDSWMSSLSLPLCFAASGAALVLYQMGGGAMPNHPMMPAINPTVVSPFLYVTGNALAYSRSPDNFDFDSSAIMTKAAPIDDEGERLLDHLIDIASGTFTKMETLDYAEQLEVFMEGPVL